MNPLLLVLAVLPGLVLSYIIFRVDKYDREPFGALLLCFALGAAVTFPAIYVEKFTFSLIGFHERNFVNTFLLAFGAIATNEELCKFAVLMLAAYPYRYFNEPLDGIVYAVLIGMGFGAIENIVYAGRFGIDTIFVRSFTAIPAHFVFGVTMGYYAGLAKFNPARSRSLLLYGLGIAIVLHGLYDFLIIQNWSDWLAVLGTCALYLSLYYCSQLVKEHLENSPFRHKDKQENL